MAAMYIGTEASTLGEFRTLRRSLVFFSELSSVPFLVPLCMCPFHAHLSDSRHGPKNFFPSLSCTDSLATGAPPNLVPISSFSTLLRVCIFSAEALIREPFQVRSSLPGHKTSDTPRVLGLPPLPIERVPDPPRLILLKCWFLW